jgi:D-hydroxyproline dehydrogenase subunit beta
VSDRVDLLVVGGGVLGAFHAYHALRRGLRVRLLERSPVPVGASARNFGQVVPSGMAQGPWQAHGRDSTRLYREIHDEVDIGLRQGGSLYLASDDDEARLLEELHAIDTGAGYPCELLDPASCLARLPNLRASYVRLGLLFAQEIQLEPLRTVATITRWLTERHGLDHQPHTTAVAIDDGGDGVIVRDGHGRHHRASRVVVCSGVDASTLFAERLANSDVETCQLQMLRTEPVPGVALRGSVLTGRTIRRYESFRACPSYARIAAAAPHDAHAGHGIHLLFTQRSDGSVVIGDSHDYRPIGAAEALPFERDERVDDLILEEARRILDLPRWRLAGRWLGRYAQTPRGLHIDDVTPTIRILTGIGGKGMTAGPSVAGESVAAMLGGTPAS